MTDTRAFGQLLTNAPTFDESVKGPLVLKKAAGKKANKKKKKKKNIKKKNKDATPPKPETVVIKVPEGKQAGDEMVIEGHLGKFRVNVPEGLKAGDEFNLEIKEPNPEPDIVTVKVPEGNQAGDEMVIEGHLGKFKVNVPEGLKAGDEFNLEIKEPNPEPDIVTVKVPEGKQAGDEMVIEGHLGKFKVNVPEGLKAGDEFNLEIKEPNPEPDIVTVKVPEGNQAGDEMVIEGHLGKFRVNVPEGLKAGDEFQIKIDESNVEREEVVTVIVPAGAKAGDTITIDGDKGKFNCTVPEGFNEGDTFNCKLDEVNPEPEQ